MSTETSEGIMAKTTKSGGSIISARSCGSLCGVAATQLRKWLAAAGGRRRLRAIWYHLRKSINLSAVKYVSPQ